MAGQRSTAGLGTEQAGEGTLFAGERVETWRGYYRQMALIRAFELRAAEMYQRAKIGGYCHAARRPGDLRSRGAAVTVMSYWQSLHDTLRAELLRDESVILLGEEIGVFEGSYKITAGLLTEFGPARVRDTPICEEGFVGTAIGAAMLGMRPVVEIMTISFSLLAIDQIVNHAGKMHAMFGGQVSVPLVIRTPGGGGQQLAATHSQNLEVWYAHVPGIEVVAPATPADAKALLTAAIRDDDPETSRAVVLEDGWLSYGRRRGDRGHHSGGSVRLPRRAGAPGGRRGDSAAVRQAARAGRAAHGRRSDQGYRRSPRSHPVRAINIGVAVALEDGLIVPVIRDADRKRLSEIAAEAHALAVRARAGKLAPDKFSHGTFTISNLGMFGIDHFTALINPPEAAILAVGAAQEEAVVRDGQLVVGTTTKLTLSIDHRVLDGATAAAFLRDLVGLVERPLRILA